MWQGQQICFIIDIRDDDLVESAETAVICGCSPHNVTFNGCATLIILDDDSKVLYFALNNKSWSNAYIQGLWAKSWKILQHMYAYIIYSYLIHELSLFDFAYS